MIMSRVKEQTVDESKNPKGQKISFLDRVTVKMTKKNPFAIDESREHKLHPIHAKKLIEKGFAVEVK